MTKVYFKTFGCTLNFSDTEVMQGILVDVGFEIVHSEDEAEVIVVNTCTVKKPTEKKVLRYLKDIKELRKPVVVAGCMAQAMPESLKGYSLLGPDNLAEIVQVIEETMHDNPVTVLKREKNPRLNLPKVRKNAAVEIIPICSGCMGECSYCVVKYARGSFYSYDKQEIITQARSALNDNVKEIWLTAQDTGCYGKDTDTFLPALLRELVALPGSFRIRVGMMNPDHVIRMLDDLIEVYKSDKIFKFLHIPVQSGNDSVLKRMKRKYTADDFRRIVTEFRKQIPKITIATDMICGFPGETKEQFDDSVALANEIRPDVLNISKFGPRPHTPALKMKQLGGDEIKKRSARLSSVFRWISFEQNKSWRNWEGSIIIDEKGTDDSWVGRNFAYKPVIVRGDYQLGQEVDVRILSVTDFHLRAIVK